MATNLDSLSTFFRKMGSNLQNFYSSRPKEQTSKTCVCRNFDIYNTEEIEFYTTQSQMITQTCHILSQPNRSEGQHIFAQILMLSVSYIDKILNLLNNKILCPYTSDQAKDIISEAGKLKEKVKQCENLKNKLKIFQKKQGNKFEIYQLKESQVDLRPITARNNEKQDLVSSEAQFPNSMKKSNHQFSLTCSQISQCTGTQYMRENIKPTPILKKKSTFTDKCDKSSLSQKGRIFGEKSGIFQSHLY